MFLGGGLRPVTRFFSAASVMITAGPIVTIASEQADALAIADNDQAEAVMLDFVNPFRRRRHHRALGRDGGLKTHAVEIGIPPAI